MPSHAGWSGMAGKQCSPYFFSSSWNNDQTPESMGKLLQDEPIDNVYLLSANASYITGSVVKVDGGMIRGV